MISQTLDKLSEMHLGAMAAEYRRQAELPAMSELGFEERFSMVVDAQWLYRNNAKLKRLLKQADLSEPHACLADIDYDPVRKLDRAQIARLSYLDFVRQGQDILITGATGTGKSFIASALGHEACCAGMTVRTFRVSRLLTNLAIGRGDGSYNKLMDELKKPQLLILDDFGLEPLDPTGSRDLYEVIYERHGLRSTIMTSQLPVAMWYTMFVDKTIADAVMDRIVNGSIRIDAKGPSRRGSLFQDSCSDREPP